tara:strand:- start:69 stop:485 length:417 start_codon:yes stop_codon:yes gene_type:complete
MKKKLSKIQSSSVDPPSKYSNFHENIKNIAQNDGGEEEVYKGGTLPEFTIEVKGSPSIKSKDAVKLPLEGNYPTMPGANLASAGYKGLGGSTDYYYRGSKDKPEVIGEADIEGGKVTGVYGDNPSFYGPKKEHQRKKK